MARPGRNGGPAGDLFVEIHVAPARAASAASGNNLTDHASPITFAEAALGGDIDVPTLDGPDVTLRLKPGHAASGSRHRVKGKGIVASKRDGSTGDLIVTVDVVVPDRADRRSRRPPSKRSPRRLP